VITIKICVVGGGPAGSTAAIELIRKGHEVDLYEALPQPRSICAGGIGFKILEELERVDYVAEAIKHSKESEVHKFTVKVTKVKGVRRVINEASVTSKELGRTLGVVVDREKFDEYLLKKAEKYGVNVYRQKPVRPKHIKKNRVYVFKEGWKKYDVVIDARGFNAWNVIKEGGLFLNQVWLPGSIGDEMIIEFPIDWLKEGYVWFFPAGNQVKVGFGENINYYDDKMFDEFVELYKIPYYEKDLKARAGVLPTGEKQVLSYKGVFRVGTAAGLVNPLHGGGIGYAILSAKALASALDVYKIGRYAVYTFYKANLSRIITEIKVATKIKKKVLEKGPKNVIKVVEVLDKSKRAGVREVLSLFRLILFEL